MDESILLQELETLAEELNIVVRYDALEGRGGLCRYGGKTYLIASNDLNVNEKIDLFCRVYSRLNLDSVFIRPQVRERIEKCAPGQDPNRT